MQLWPLYPSYLFLIPQNFHILDIKYPKEIYSPSFAVGGFSKLYLYPSIPLKKDSRNIYLIDGVLSAFQK